jgi:hypothetical protein
MFCVLLVLRIPVIPTFLLPVATSMWQILLLCDIYLNFLHCMVSLVSYLSSRHLVDNGLFLARLWFGNG